MQPYFVDNIYTLHTAICYDNVHTGNCLSLTNHYVYSRDIYSALSATVCSSILQPNYCVIRVQRILIAEKNNDLNASHDTSSPHLFNLLETGNDCDDFISS